MSRLAEQLAEQRFAWGAPRALACAACLALGALAGGCSQDPPRDPLQHLATTGELTLSPGNETGQDEDPAILRAADGRLYLAWYSNRNGVQPDGVEDKEIFLARSSDGASWTDPPVQVTRKHAHWAFAPSLAQDDAGGFHVAWWRWTPLPEGCSGTACTGGSHNRIMYKASANGVDWDLDQETVVADGPGDWLPSLVFDRVRRRLLVYFASPVRDATGVVDLGQSTLRIYVSENAGSGWGPPRRLEGVTPGTSHDTYPYVVQREDGQFLMTWTRYGAAASGFDPLEVVRQPSTETLYSTSSDGVTWSAPVEVSGNGAAIDVFPSLYADHARSTWSVLWLTTARVTTGSTEEAPVGGSYPADLVDRPEVLGYTGRVVATPTPGIFWGVWVNGPDGRQKIRGAFFSR